MKWIWGASEFVRRIRHRLQFGERSRAPLRLLRLELREDSAECEWLARKNDPWDADLPVEIREENETFQTLRDALTVREFLFSAIPEIRWANFKVYRVTEGQSAELIITGSVSREDEPPARIPSLVMRAKVCGLRFNLSDGGFEGLGREPSEMQLIHQ